MSTSVDQKQDFFTVVHERHSVRYYDPSVQISKQELEDILQEATLAPSSSNLQPWRFLVIDEQALKEKLLPIAYNQQQVVDASAVIAVFGDMEWFNEGEKIYAKSVEAGYMSEAVKQQMVATVDNGYRNMDEARKKKIVHIDGGLISMQLMLVARAKGYDTVPMGGYDVAKFNEAFEIPAHYENIMLIALGKAAKPGHATVRLSVDEVTHWNTIK
ncbi:nitroreductase family protein [Paenibacillus selenitireducens]|uniref:Nitroreductase family protein n=1 Tax=Paenibacillus selenitireducens TaxID=1324314 RepID=A0A1T2XHQ9_9BACL|nr:nitroreductase family protein [Paenibacillus selenitireducens]OPA79429.1 nitroreductase family protein [Paenibacillus selenitireducens]